MSLVVLDLKFLYLLPDSRSVNRIGIVAEDAVCPPDDPGLVERKAYTISLITL